MLSGEGAVIDNLGGEAMILKPLIEARLLCSVVENTNGGIQESRAIKMYTKWDRKGRGAHGVHKWRRIEACQLCGDDLPDL